MNEPKTIDRAEDTGCCGAAPCSAKTSDQEKERRRNIIGGAWLESTGSSDNLAVALLCYFESHIEYEDLGKDENETDIWALQKANEALDRIADTVWPNDQALPQSVRKEDSL